MNADQVTGFFNNDPGGSVGYRKNPGTGLDPIVTDVFLSRSATFWGRKATSNSFPLFGSRMITFRSSISLGWSLRTSPARIQLRVISSSINRFRGLRVLKMISSTTSFSRILNWAGLPALNSFLRVGLSHGFWKSESIELLMKLNKAARRVNRNFFCTLFGSF